MVDTINNLNGGSDWNLHSASTTTLGLVINSGSALKDRELKSAAFWLKKTGSPSGDVYIEIRDATNHNNVQTLGSLGASGLTTSYSKQTISYGSGFTLDTNHWLCVRYEGGDGSNSVDVEWDSSANYDSTNTVQQRYKQSTSSITTYNDRDLKFEVTVTSTGGGSGGGGEEEEESSSGSISGTGGPSPTYAMRLNIGYIR